MSKVTKVAINGFGRIGRLAFRQMFGAEGYEVVAMTIVITVIFLQFIGIWFKFKPKNSAAGKFTLTANLLERTGCSLLMT